MGFVTMKTRKQILEIIERLDGCQITSTQIREQLSKPIGKATINWHIERLVKDGLVETIQRTSANTGSVIRIKSEAKHDH